MTGETVFIAVAIAAAFASGYGLRAEQDRQRALKPKTLKQLMREQRIKPVRSAVDLPAFDPVLFTVEDLARWDAAMREAREP